jgi:hypothetical protein
MQGLDRYITGNYGEDQFRDEWQCPGHNVRFIGHEPDDYDHPETGQHPVYQCRNCGELFDSRYCGKPMRDGACVLDLDHRGRHTTVGFYCDNCGKMRRGQPAGSARDIDGEPLADFCWFCMNVEER